MTFVDLETLSQRGEVSGQMTGSMTESGGSCTRARPSDCKVNPSTGAPPFRPGEENKKQQQIVIFNAELEIDRRRRFPLLFQRQGYPSKTSQMNIRTTQQL